MKKLLLAAMLAAPIGCDDQHTEGAKGAMSRSPQYQEAHKTDVNNPLAEAPPAGSVAAPGSYSGPGTPTQLPTTRPEVVTASSVFEARRREVDNRVLKAATQPSQQQQGQQQQQQRQQQQ